MHSGFRDKADLIMTWLTHIVVQILYLGQIFKKKNFPTIFSYQIHSSHHCAKLGTTCWVEKCSQLILRWNWFEYMNTNLKLIWDTPELFVDYAPGWGGRRPHTLWIHGPHIPHSVDPHSRWQCKSSQPAVWCGVGLGYHRDPQTRAAFMEVLTKILQQGTEFETLAETVLADRFERLVELVTMIGDKGELPIAMALASVVANPHMVLLLWLYTVSQKNAPTLASCSVFEAQCSSK